MAAKKHHFVPKFYQRGFADIEGLLWRYDRQRRVYQHLAPEVICREENLYAVRPEGQPLDQRIETDILAPIDSKASTAIRRIAKRERLSQDEFEHFCLFMGFQYTRLPSFGRAIRRSYEATLDMVARMQFANVERARDALASINEDPAEAEGMVDAIRSGSIRCVATERPFLENMAIQAQTLAEFSTSCEWTYLVAPKDTGFVVCDHPFTIVAPRTHTDPGGSYGTPGAISYFPLTRELCLRLYPSRFSIRYKNISNQDVRIINLNICANSERFIMGRHKVELEHLIRRSQCEGLEANERFSVETIREDENEGLQKFVMLRQRNFY